MSTQGRDDAPRGSKPRDPELDRAWHAASAEPPPAAVDARILAAARAAVASPSEHPVATPVRRRWRGPTRWHSLLAAAAVAGLAFVLVPRTANQPTRDFEAPPERARQDSVATPAESVAAPALEDKAGDASAQRPLALPEHRGTVRDKRAASAPPPMRDDAPPPRSEPTLPPPPTAAAAAEGVAGESPRAVAGPAPQATSRERSADDQVSTADAAAWAARIEALHSAGELTAAARELQAFRAAVPDAETYLTPTLRDWARTVP